MLLETFIMDNENSLSLFYLYAVVVQESIERGE